VRETRFGAWFQRTATWARYVVGPALDDLDRLLRARGGPRRVGRILDAGCGAGVAFAQIEARWKPHSLTAVEIDPALLGPARREASCCVCEVSVCLENLESLGFPDATFDLVLCHQTLHHVSDQQAALRELYRVIAPGGVLLLAESCRRFTGSWAVRALFRHPHAGQRTAEQYVALVRAAGFEVAEDGVSTPDPFWARPDFGLRGRLSGRVRAAGEATQVNLVGERQLALAERGSTRAR
jgi:SAM-dependent methyltransferase